MEPRKLIVEVKAWEKGVSRQEVLRFMQMKEALEDQLERRAVFLF